MKTKRRYFAAINSYSTETSIGFANTWSVIVFNSKKNRDEFVKNSSDLATRSITKSEVTRYAANYSLMSNDYNKPRPFSGQYWGIRDDLQCGDNPQGLIGRVAVCDMYDKFERLYN